MEFVPFTKVPRLSREVVVTEKIDGTNASVYIEEVPIDLPQESFETGVCYVPHEGKQFALRCGSRTRWITPSDDNFGFAQWAFQNSRELVKLGEGHHFGEWWGRGIQRGYGLSDRRFSLFNVSRWSDDSTRPSCVSVVPTLYVGEFDTNAIHTVLAILGRGGSRAAPGFMNPEGVIVYHTAANQLFKKTINKDHEPKSKEVA